MAKSGNEIMAKMASISGIEIMNNNNNEENQ